jgi:hypothetical protein
LAQDVTQLADCAVYFRQKAAECALIAKLGATSQVRDSYQELERHWQELAEHAERMINLSKAD